MVSDRMCLWTKNRISLGIDLVANTFNTGLYMLYMYDKREWIQFMSDIQTGQTTTKVN